MFAQPFDHSFNDIFHQYVNMDTPASDGKDPMLSSTQWDQFFPLDSLSSECGDLSPAVSTSKRLPPSPQPWPQDWSLQDDSCLGDQFALSETVHPSVISGQPSTPFETPARPTLTHRATIAVAPTTPPVTPQRKATKSALLTPKSIRHRNPNERRNLMRKQSFSPSLMQSTISKGRMSHPEAWAQRIQNFTLTGSDDRLPLSPPPSDILLQQGGLGDAASVQHPRSSAEMTAQYDARLFHQSPAISMPSPSADALARHSQQYMSQSASSALTNSSPSSADDIFSTSHSSDPHSLSSCYSDSLTASFSFTPDLQSQEAQWWSPMPSRVSQPSTNYHSMVPSPAPHRSLSTANGQQDMMQGGLMIQMDSSFDMSNDPSLLTMGGQKFMAPFAAPQAHNVSRSPSRSPSGGSPKDASNSARSSHSRKHSRKLSGQSTSTPKPTKSSTSPRGANKSVNVSFVNFTAHDSKKILTGVAPSGSSKTKARREQEARERRRKMSEAALRAVRNAGGNVEALEAVFY
ncbi:Developmental regulatory protein wetA-like protein [Penicillium ucsense]|uniref:Developmental regulatory protein wetA n=1 Tax=Penicillium ucsense TaxID=2839758 RepID=A0A8J8WIE6_9EURO|nr:Developmental regulatory protein wetA-like protein [Penicillium ucsense]KAF7736368.1 Developmental regulatory protein wetA-like protein [Penicillium ucsense]